MYGFRKCFRIKNKNVLTYFNKNINNKTDLLNTNHVKKRKKINVFGIDIYQINKYCCKKYMNYIFSKEEYILTNY